MQIKLATTQDICIIQQLAHRIWPVAYEKIISPEQLAYMVALIYNEAALKVQMESGHQFILALQNEVPIGFASYSKKNEVASHTYTLHKIYVLPKITTKGIGTFLLSYVLDTIIKKGATLLELNVNKYNPAMQFYFKKGFTVLRDEVIDIGDGYVMDDYVMQKRLG